MNQALLSGIASKAYDKLLKATESKQPIAVTGLPDTMAAYIASKLCADTGKKVLLISGNDLKAAHDAEDGQQLLETGVACLPGGEIDLTRGASSHESAWRRLEALARAQEGDIRLLCTSMDAALQRMGSADRFREETICLAPGDRIDLNDLIRRLTAMGYERVSMVEGKGQCALRGGIIDVYPPACSQSLRIEFFDDEVDSIREFDCISQRSLDSVEKCTLTPATEVLLPTAEAEKAARRMRDAIERQGGDLTPASSTLFSDLPPLPEDDADAPDFFDKNITPKIREKQQTAARKAELERRRAQLMADADMLAEGLPFKRIRAWLTVLTDDTYTVLDWFEPEIVVLSDPNLLRKRAEERRAGFAEDLEGAMSRDEAVKEQETLLMDWDELLRHVQGYATVAVTEFLEGMAGVAVKDAADLGVQRVAGYSSQIRPLAEDCDGWLREGYRVAVLCGGVARGQRLAAALEEHDVAASFAEKIDKLPEECVQVLPGTLTHGFIWEEARLIVVSDTDVYGTGYRKAKKRQAAGEKIAAFTDLKPGDFVVHEEHGVGIYLGTAQMKNGGTRRDYLQIQYQGSDKLYVPIEALSRVQRYIGNPANPPKLNKLGGGDWQKQKAKVKSSIKEIAGDLIKLYAERKAVKGYAFSPDTPWQREFEDAFPFEETPDQLTAIAEIKKDMEKPQVMDRLLCGDVGYGKTEVALRAIFKCVMDGKQAALLAPTTILVQQHYATMLNRFHDFPIHVDTLSRFKTAAEQKQTIENLKSGKLDVIIGTHRLLNKDIEFKDLGLLVVDEEQRFGVGHKEAIKQYKKSIDVLTLSATPIPRTLHMSMVGIRDMSLLQSPPEERYPVQTYVVEYSDGLVRDAILRELGRGGQVYVLHNRVQTIDMMYQRLKKLVPEARIAVGHGQMREHQLEDVMLDFYEGKFDVLLCTTIIEAGLDVPRANTLIVCDSDHFGLSQLYQLRGRVGRSNRLAYAYLTVNPSKILTQDAEKRLNAIREFTEFGSGFRVAMRDLEIRGTGNLLGAEQSGHMAAVGYDLYVKMIEETVHEMRGDVGQGDIQTRVEVKADAYLPAEYVSSDVMRMEMYKKIAGIDGPEARDDLIEELIDRFGDPTRPVINLIDIAQLKSLCGRLGIDMVSGRGDALVMRFSMLADLDIVTLLKALEPYKSCLRFTPSNPPTITYAEPGKKQEQLLKGAVEVMQRVVDAVAPLDRAKEEA